MKRFETRVAVISDGADGLGFGIAERIASEDGRICLFDINETLLTKALETFKEKGYTAEGYKVDISSEQEMERTIGLVKTTFGKIDIMVNSANCIRA